MQLIRKVTGLAAIAALALSACQSTSASRASSTSVASTTTVAPAVLQFATCSKVQCATVNVPTDWWTPGLGTIALNVYRRLGSADASQKVPLFIHPGGPGADMAGVMAKVDQLLGKDVEYFDIVGLSTRASPDKTPAQCVDSLNPIVLASASDAAAKEVADGCLNFSGSLIDHSGTLESVEDLDYLRRSLGYSQVNFLGWSYGATLGTAWVMVHPASLKNVVLDAPGDPGQPWSIQYQAELDAQQADLKAGMQACTETPSCPLGKLALEKVQQLATSLRTKPLPAVSNGLEVNDVSLGIAAELSMYSGDLTNFISAAQSAMKGNAKPIADLVDGRLGRLPNGKDDGGMETQILVRCSDTTHADDQAAINVDSQFTPSVIRVGLGAALNRVCLHLPEPSHPLGDVAASTLASAANVMVVSSQGDPVIPYSVSSALANRFGWGLVPVTSIAHLSVGFDATATSRALQCLRQGQCS